MFSRIGNWLMRIVRPPFISGKLNKWKSLRSAKREDYLQNYYNNLDEE